MSQLRYTTPQVATTDVGRITSINLDYEGRQVAVNWAVGTIVGGKFVPNDSGTVVVPWVNIPSALQTLMTTLWTRAKDMLQNRGIFPAGTEE